MGSKEYEIDGMKLRVSVLETTSAPSVLERKADLITAMQPVGNEDGADEVLFFVVDILKEEATMLIANERQKAIAEKSFDVSVEGDQVVLPGIVSRKKQIIPALKV